jgi:hypothetical protein
MYSANQDKIRQDGPHTPSTQGRANIHTHMQTLPSGLPCLAVILGPAFRSVKYYMQTHAQTQTSRITAGAPFVLHRGSDKAQRHVWVAESGAEGGAMLRWQSHKAISWQRLRASRANVSKVQYHEAAVHLIQSVTYGTQQLLVCWACPLMFTSPLSSPWTLPLASVQYLLE